MAKKRIRVEDQSVPKKHKSDDWVAPEPLPDTEHNPWPDDPSMELVQQGTKVAFVDEGHQYYLQDGKNAYPDHIISCSSLIKYWGECIKVLACGDENTTDVVVQAKQCMDRFKMSKCPMPKSTTSPEGPHAILVRKMLSNYLNRFLEWKSEEPPSFPDRQLRLAAHVPPGCGKTFNNHIRHAALRDLENWLLERGEPSFTRSDTDYIDILRYLKCPTEGYSHVTAESKSGASLSVFLENEVVRLGGPFPPMSAGEISQAAGILAAGAGTIAHRYIECQLLGIKDEQPELREREDLESITAMLSYLDKKGVKFDPECIERRVGSLLYKMCGSMDALRKRPDGVYEIWDWKRTQNVHDWIKNAKQKDEDDPHHWVCDMTSINFSDSLMTYHIQAAGYHQLESHSFPTKVISNSAFLGAFHPSFERGFIILEMILDAPMKQKALAVTKGISRYAKDGEVCECTELSSLDYVKSLMHHRLGHLKRHYKCDPMLDLNTPVQKRQLIEQAPYIE